MVILIWFFWSSAGWRAH